MIVLIEIQERQNEEKRKGISSRIWNIFGGLQKSETDLEIGESYLLLMLKQTSEIKTNHKPSTVKSITKLCWKAISELKEHLSFT